MSSIVVAGDTSGSITIQAPAVAGSGTVLTLPTTTGTLYSTTGGGAIPHAIVVEVPLVAQGRHSTTTEASELDALSSKGRCPVDCEVRLWQ